MDSGNPRQPPSNGNPQTSSTENDGRERRKVNPSLTDNTTETRYRRPLAPLRERVSSDSPAHNNDIPQQHTTQQLQPPPSPMRTRPRKPPTTDATLLTRYTPIIHPTILHRIHTWREKTMALASPAAESHRPGFILLVRAIVPDYLPADTQARVALAMILCRFPASDAVGSEVTGRLADARFSLDDEDQSGEVEAGGRVLRDVEVAELRDGVGRMAVVKFWRVRRGEVREEEEGEAGLETLVMRTGGEVRGFRDQ